MSSNCSGTDWRYESGFAELVQSAVLQEHRYYVQISGIGSKCHRINSCRLTDYDSTSYLPGDLISYPSDWRAAHLLRSATAVANTFGGPNEQRSEEPYFHSRPSNPRQMCRCSYPWSGNVAVRCNYPVERAEIYLQMRGIRLVPLNHRRGLTDQPFRWNCDGGRWWLWRESFRQTRTTHYLLATQLQKFRHLFATISDKLIICCFGQAVELGWAARSISL